MSRMRRLRTTVGLGAITMKYLALIVCGGLLGGVEAHSDSPAPTRPRVDEQGTLHLPAYELPQSIYTSDVAQRTYVALNSAIAGIKPGDSAAIVDIMRQFVQAAEAAYPVTIEKKLIAGIPTNVVRPRAGVSPKNRRRVLINLHGGGTSNPPPEMNELIESITIAAVAGIEVISVDYRFEPPARFPAASSDVERVYRRLLREYRPENIGIYGCSFGGILTGQFVAWLERKGLPLPGAVGIFCSGAEWPYGGDSAYFAMPFFGGNPAAPASPNPPVYETIAYFSEVDPRDPLVSPVLDPKMLARFPPTLLITGSRDFMLSSAVHTHAQLVKAGVHADLHILEGMWHAFFYSVDMPESKQAYEIIARFFNERLGGASSSCP